MQNRLAKRTLCIGSVTWTSLAVMKSRSLLGMLQVSGHLVKHGHVHKDKKLENFVILVLYLT